MAYLLGKIWFLRENTICGYTRCSKKTVNPSIILKQEWRGWVRERGRESEREGPSCGTVKSCNLTKILVGLSVAQKGLFFEILWCDAFSCTFFILFKIWVKSIIRYLHPLIHAQICMMVNISSPFYDQFLSGITVGYIDSLPHSVAYISWIAEQPLGLPLCYIISQPSNWVNLNTLL